MKVQIGLLFIAALALPACQSSSGGGGSATPAPGPNKLQGSSTGGGSFESESSLTLLHWAADDLAQQILNSSPEIYTDLPPGWTQQRLAEAIKNVEPTEKDRETYKIPEVNRYGERLMFANLTHDDGTSYITATQLYDDAYSNQEVNSRPKEEFYYTLQEIKLKLAHEVAHLMDLGNSRETDMPEARAFAKSLMAALDSDNVECLPTAAPPPEIYTHIEAAPEYNQSADFFLHSTRAYVFNRPTGKSAVPSNVGRRCPGDHNDQPDHCHDNENYDPDSSQTINVSGVDKSYNRYFELKTIKASVLHGRRVYGEPGGYFKWSSVDVRKAVLTDKGYRSEYKYGRAADETSYGFSDFLDFRVLKSSQSDFVMETFPPLEQESWTFYRSAGRARIYLHFNEGRLTKATLNVLKDFRPWVDQGPPAQDINLSVPLTCVRSFRALTMPAK